ncbi:alpha/beta hydrolase family protein [Streptomyces sp. NPDC057694]|uniref:alpha/beta hydrolase family protein n=1 Tax=Streptomyces sp. NPDC057694 TaxID=3346216 RepID=UPI003684C950
MTTRSRRAALATLLTFGLSAPLLGAASTSSTHSRPLSDRGADGCELALPPPAGPYPVGRRVLHLVDRHRADPWVSMAANRELMVSVSYPARSTGGRRAAYMAVDEAQLLLEARGLGGVVPAATVAGTRTHAQVSASPASGRFPLVLLSPGFSMPRSTLTALADDLAGRGYVVASVDHAYESVGTQFPGGRILTCAACEQVNTPAQEALAVRGRAADLSYVIDELTSYQRTRVLSGMIDPRRIGIAGHSIGGAAAAATMAADPRVRAGVDLDGDFFVHPAGAGLGRRPFMMLGADSTHGPDGHDTDWPEAWSHLHGWKRWLTVTGAEHFSFTDLPYLADQLGLSDPAVPLSGVRGWSITRDYVTAFFDRHLRELPRPILDGPTASEPEVMFRDGV